MNRIKATISTTRATISSTRSGIGIARHHGMALFTKEREQWVPEKPTVILLHGYLVGDASMHGMAKYLTQRGFNTDCQSYPFWEDLRIVEEEMEEKLEGIYHRAGGRFIIIGHSQGGLVGYALAQSYPQYINLLITEGAPFNGTNFAKIADNLAKVGRFMGKKKQSQLEYLATSARQMLPGSEYLIQLNNRGAPQIPVFSIAGGEDVVVPAESARLRIPSPNIENILVDGLSHGGMISRPGYKIIEKVLHEHLQR
ncbi:MAG: lysophospholipase [Nanoarchaeota archaeon]|nr:lysophospholipase [Nanoarchaeota archaeon]MBU1622874.1 lysophospholipase [Nanoarchaeota archaeon]MBU1974053.1 lysophospholipase [Nanoarchaeota archaeon]